jgi:hypothetical protein
MKFMPDYKDPDRVWVHIGGDLEASYDGARYVDIRQTTSKERILFISRGALKNAIALFDPPPIAE